MSSNPAKRSRAAGCFLLVLFGMFVALPGMGLVSMLSGDFKTDDNPLVVVAMLCVFLIIGLIGVYFGFRMLLGKSPTAAESKLTRAIPGSALPSVPKSQQLSNGYLRLRPESTHAGTFWLLLFVSLFWNGITWTMIFAGSSSSSPDGPPPLWFSALFAIVGVILIIVTVKAFLRWIMVGETHVDVNASTATPGQIIELLVSQPGKYNIDRLTVDFVCREKASYKAGTETRTKTEITYEAPVCDHETLTSRDGRPLTHQSAVIPADAMLSFKSSNNQVNWLIRVKMVLPRRPDVEQFYPIRVVSPEILRQEKSFPGKS